MFCKKCGNRLLETDTFCPHCGTVVAQDALSARLTVQLPKEEPPVIPAPAQENASLQQAAAQAFNTPLAAAQEPQPPVEPAPVYMPPTHTAPAALSEAETAATPNLNLPDLELPDLTPHVAPAEPPAREPGVMPEYPPAAAEAAAHPVPAPQKITRVHETKREKSSRTALEIIALSCAVLTLVFAALGKYTTLFSKEQDATKTVALSGFSDAERESFLAFFAPFSALYGQDIEFDETDTVAFLSLLHPEDSNGLYATAAFVPMVEVETADPLERFPDGYYVLETDKIEAIAQQLGIPFVANANTADFYFHDNQCYVRAAQPTQSAQRTVTTADARRTEEGNYYVTCTCDDNSSVYCLVACDKRGETPVWTLKTLSDEPLFSADGTQIAINNDVLDYEIRQTVIDAKTADGQLYAQYVVNYPYFPDSTSATAQTINTLYAEIVNSYRQKAGEAEKSYARYLKKGYDTALLPAYTYVVSTVSYNQNGWISLLDEITTYTPETFAKAKQKAAEAGEEWNDLLRPTRAYSGYTANLETGEVLRKEDLFGQSYEEIQDALSERYLASPDELYSGDEQATIGQQIYSSAWILTESGVAFCYQGQEGYMQLITLPFSEVPNAETYLTVAEKAD